QHHEVRREMESEHLVYLEAAVLRTVPSQIHEREQRILLVEDAIRREVQDAAAGCLPPESCCGGRAAGETRYIRAAGPSDRRRFPPRRRQRIRSRRQRQGAARDGSRRPITQGEPDRCRGRHGYFVALDEKLSVARPTQQRRERQVVQLGMRNEKEPRLAGEQARLFKGSDQILVQLSQRPAPQRFGWRGARFLAPPLRIAERGTGGEDQRSAGELDQAGEGTALDSQVDDGKSVPSNDERERAGIARQVFDEGGIGAEAPAHVPPRRSPGRTQHRVPGTALPHLQQQLAVRLVSAAQRLAGSRARSWRLGATQRVRVRAVNVVGWLGQEGPQILLP